MLRYVDEFRDASIVAGLAGCIREISTKPFNIMEVCGGHTMSIRKSGIHRLVGENIRLISGPGCPVCVTSLGDIDKAVALARVEGVTVCSFGDMIYVPGSESSLARERTNGRKVLTVYSVRDALEAARTNPGEKVVFISIGFETTAPTAAAAVIEAREKGIKNFSVLALNKTMPKALEAVLAPDNSKIDALLCPGHVSTITGLAMYRPIVETRGVSCCISGFEPVDILRAVHILTGLFEKGEKALVNAYERAVKEDGNEKAKEIMNEVFEETDAEWRGFGVIPKSGLRIRDKYEEFDAEKIFDIDVPEAKEQEGCVCGDILRGVKTPTDCCLFGKSCTPENPKGACMVSSEGACAAWRRYGELGA